MLTAKLHHGLTQVRSQVIPNEDFDLLLGDPILNILEEDLLEKDLELPHVEPSAFVSGEYTAWRSAHGPGIIEIAAQGLQNRHGWQAISMASDAEHRAEARFAVVPNLFRVSDSLLE